MGDILQFVGELVLGLVIFVVIAAAAIWFFVMWLNDFETPSRRRTVVKVDDDDEMDYLTMTLDEACDVLREVRQSGFNPEDPYSRAVVDHAERMVRQAQGA